ncbi:carboxypeptidase-like regulatory domain-containing protein [Urbifossiella limnaea]|uniref:Carboxypeptidase regulatory-like domain-containing protein n=1 Tax=Urbifossiella limnaea TaxID=2528023 RepID=A0A517XNR5_9BACT|nr:carboxypeptidase-like regulatory domain-containing protein [Urbifossiella limnaea]QDU19154.1 hypothetical protein ETAA1_10580 [Urbifossiella limnaea]
MRLGSRIAAVAALVVVAGCGKQPGEVEKLPTQPARGFVKYKGAPVKDASVSFQSLDGKVAANGKTDGVGSFTLSTYGQADGLPAGKYKVVVAVSAAKEIEPGVLAPEPEGGFKSPIPAKYANPSTTDILVEVKPGDSSEILIDLK